MAWKKEWLPFPEARDIVAAKGFTAYREFEQWKERPPNIPANPRQAYTDEWAGREYWIGAGPPKESSRPKVRVEFLPFDQARALAQELMRQYEIVNQSGWFVFAKTSDRPSNIPADPSSTYQDKGWVSWPDWFGRKPSRASGREEVRPFLEAREFARSMGLKSADEWYAWAKVTRPDNIPYSPDARYQGEGWIGWPDFLGYCSRWTHFAITSFLDSLEPCIEQLTELDLYLILSKNGMLRRDPRLRVGKLLRGLKNSRTKEDLQNAKRRLADELNKPKRDPSTPDTSDGDADRPVSDEELSANDGSALRTLDILAALQTVDRVSELGIPDDGEVLDLMVAERVGLLWQEVMASGESAVFEHLDSLQGGAYATLIKDQFTDTYRRVRTLGIPDGYRLMDAAGQPADLNIMQRLTAYRLVHDRRIGNWSGVGAGKTNAAIFAAAVLGADFTIILAANATIAGWKRSLERSFDPESIHVHSGTPREFQFQLGKKNFLIANYETFQRKWTGEFIDRVTRQARIDFIILDEVQFARQRYQSEARKSQRREHVDDLIGKALHRNPELRLLAMSATPVVNNLREAVNVLKLLWPERDFAHIPVGASIANAVGVHRLLREHGIRHVPRYEQQLVKQTVVVDGQAWLPRLENLRPKDLLLMEQTLLEAKLEHVGAWVRRGTLIYTQYVEEIVEPTKRAIERLGLRIASFTGKERMPLEEFRKAFESNQVDVLIGSAPIGTGVDGLQFLLDRLVFLTLPWSHAEYEQIVGRLWRQGSRFHQVEVMIPQVTLREERAGQWSWDDLRLRCIEYKQTLADAAVDGIIPRGGLPSRQELHRRSIQALKLWKENVSKGMQEAPQDA